jgi:putative Holliday junction resolvase
VLALDHGTVRIGVAVSDPLGLTAQPHAVLDAGPDLLDRIGNLVTDLDVERIVIGLPTGLDGTEGDAARRARDFAAEVGRSTGLPVELVDERFSTVIAERAMIDGGARRDRRRGTRDSVAAAVFLQSYLDRP